MNDGCGRKIGPYDCCTIITGDARELGEAIPDGNINLVFTDPPYIRSEMYLYRWLGAWSARVLDPSGFLLAYAGNVWLDDAMAALRGQLEYVWDFASMMSGGSSIVWDRRIISRWKSILCYRLLGSTAVPPHHVLGAWVGGGKDKRYHAWGQDESTTRYYVECYAGGGALVADPFCGGGTTAAICKMLQLHYLCFEIDPGVAERARERVQNTQPPLFVVQPEQDDLGLFAADIGA